MREEIAAIEDEYLVYSNRYGDEYENSMSASLMRFRALKLRLSYELNATLFGWPDLPGDPFS